MNGENDPNNRIKELKAAYGTLFSGPLGLVVLGDLAMASSFLKPSFLDDRRQMLGTQETAINEGMRRLFLRILRFSGKEDAIWQALGGQAAPVAE